MFSLQGCGFWPGWRIRSTGCTVLPRLEDAGRFPKKQISGISQKPQKKGRLVGTRPHPQSAVIPADGPVPSLHIVPHTHLLFLSLLLLSGPELGFPTPGLVHQTHVASLTPSALSLFCFPGAVASVPRSFHISLSDLTSLEPGLSAK